MEVGGDDFIAAIIEDLNPKYKYRFDASKRLKLVNYKVVDKKKLYRKWTDGNYLVHSTDNIKEFFNHTVLLLGKDRVLRCLSSNKGMSERGRLNIDIVGANGWNTVGELFDILNLTSQYVVLRGAEGLENRVQDLNGDVDILCSDIGEFTASANARKIGKSDNFYHVNIAGQNVLFDIRFVGDGYFDKQWQQDIIDNRILEKNGVYVPKIDDYFFHIFIMHVYTNQYSMRNM